MKDIRNALIAPREPKCVHRHPYTDGSKDMICLNTHCSFNYTICKDEHVGTCRHKEMS
jgi:hypothetical protein